MRFSKFKKEFVMKVWCYVAGLIVICSSVMMAKAFDNCPALSAHKDTIQGSATVDLAWQISGRVLEAASVAEAEFNNYWESPHTVTWRLDLQDIFTNGAESLSAGDCDLGTLPENVRETLFWRDYNFAGGPYPIVNTFLARTYDPNNGHYDVASASESDVAF